MSQSRVCTKWSACKQVRSSLLISRRSCSRLRFYSSKVSENSTKAGRQNGDAREERIVITGISGRFPSANNMQQFQEKLLLGTDMVSPQSRWQTNKLPPRMGFLSDLDKFDAEFFGIPPKLADFMDPQQRKLLEVAFEAIIDSGQSPVDLKGTRTGVFVGALGAESWDYNVIYGPSESYLKCHAMACPGFMLANRISYAFDLKGTSLHVSTGCSASLIALEQAVHAIRQGTCDAAIVAGSTVHLAPEASEVFVAMGALAPDGVCKAFDDAANGFVRSEAIVAIVIQKESSARRHYATIHHIESNSDGYKDEGIMFPSGAGQEALLRSAYRNAGIDPASVAYIETHGTGTPAGDPQEVQAIYNVFCKDTSREKPLILGSVKTNMGHTEYAAGMSSVAKVVTCIQNGIIPANLNFKEPNRAIKHLFGSSLEIATQPKQWTGGLIGISSFGLGGTNSHVILEPGPTREVTASRSKIPMIVPFSGRTQEALRQSTEEAVKLVEQHPEACSILQSAFRRTIPGHGYRSFGLLSSEAAPPTIEVEALQANEKRPLWYVFPGMGSQWTGMGKDLMKFEAFAESMSESSRTLKNAGIDLDEILASNSGSIYTNIRHALVAIASVQVALYDLMASTGLNPDGYLGHSSGEILCAYADGCLNREEALLVSEARGRAFMEAVFQPGSMASVGLSWDAVKARCTPDLFPACHNSPSNVSVSGPKDSIESFVRRLTTNGIFAKEVNSCGVAPHSKYVGNAPELMEKYMKEICPEKRIRSPKWISSSIPEAEWSTHPIAAHSSAEYHANNLLQPVLFYEATKHVPSNAIVVEIAPQGFFQGLLKESLPTCSHVAPMVGSSVDDKIRSFLSSIGKIHNAGIDIDMSALYPKVSFPVPANVPCISPLVAWNHEDTWSTSVVLYPKRPGRVTLVDINDTAQSYLQGHRLGNRVVFPATGYLTLAWEGFAADHGKRIEDFPVTFENVSFERATLFKGDVPTALQFSMLDGDGTFVVWDGDAIVVKGKIKEADPAHAAAAETAQEAKENMDFMERSDAYKELRLRGYYYSGEFQGINRISLDGSYAEVKWANNWTSFLDTILQTTLFSIPTRSTVVPTRLQRLTIQPQIVLKHVAGQEQDPHVPVTYNKNLQAATCPGVQVHNITGMVISNPRQKDALIYEQYAFSSLHPTRPEASLRGLVWKITDIVKYSGNENNMNVIEIVQDADESMAKLLFEGLDKTAQKTPKVTVVTLPRTADRIRDELNGSAVKVAVKDAENQLMENVTADLIVLHDPSLLSEAEKATKDGAFILVEHSDPTDTTRFEALKTVATFSTEERSYSLFRKREQASEVEIMHIPVCSNSFDWVPYLQTTMSKALDSNQRIYLTSQDDPHCGILGFIKCIRREDGTSNIRAIFDPEGSLKLDFSSPTGLLREIVGRDLVINVIKERQLGTICHLPLPDEGPGSYMRPVEHAYINTLTTGDLGSLRWIESPYNCHIPSTNDTTFCTVSYTSLNFRDLMLATGKLPIDVASSSQDCVIGFEFSGHDPQGNRVMGIVPFKGLATSVLASSEFVYLVPESWTLEDAATVPIVYLTAYYALFDHGRLQPGQSILIHSGTGGVGQAAISIALAHNCEVFTTVGSLKKREYVKEMFPQLQDDHIGNSRDCSFEPQIMEVTRGRGVDIVLNSLADEKLEASLRCLAPQGKFLEIGAFNSFMNTPLGMGALTTTEFHGVMLNQLFGESKPDTRALRENFLQGIKTGVVKPLLRTTFKSDQIEEAFRYMASGKHVGKILINAEGSEVAAEESQKERTVKVNAVGRTYFHPEKAYVLIGGLGGLGLEVANWVVDRGARHLVLPSRSGITTGYQRMCVQKWNSKGVTVDTPKIELSEFEAAESFIKDVSNGRQLGGIINSTLVLRDALMTEQTVENFQTVAAGKILITKNMDTLTRKYCPNLDYFVTFSSIASGLGNAAQSNYGYANSVMERICESRRADGLHGLAIQWGVMGDVGFFERNFSNTAADSSEKNILGFRPQGIASALEVLDNALQQTAPVVVSVLMAEKSKRKNKSKASGLLATVSKIFGVRDIDKLSPQTKLSELGMDSLIASELKQTLERDYDFPVTVSQMRSVTIADLRNIETGTAETMKTSAVGDDGKSQVSETATTDVMFKLYEDPIIKLGSRKRDDLVPLFIVHGNLGTAETFRGLASRLECDTYGFQYGKYSEVDSINELAQAYVRELWLVHAGGPYNICGYSGGGTVAFEMTRILEQEYKAEVSNLIFLDGSCDWKHEGTDTIAVIRNILDVLQLFESEEEKQKFSASLNCDTDENIGKLISYVLRLVPSSKPEELRKCIELYLQHHFRTFSYEPSAPFNGNAILIRAAFNQFFKDDMYNLERHCHGNLSCHVVSGNHSSFLTEKYVDESVKILKRVLGHSENEEDVQRTTGRQN